KNNLVQEFVVLHPLTHRNYCKFGNLISALPSSANPAFPKMCARRHKRSTRNEKIGTSVHARCRAGKSSLIRTRVTAYPETAFSIGWDRFTGSFARTRSRATSGEG